MKQRKVLIKYNLINRKKTRTSLYQVSQVTRILGSGPSKGNLVGVQIPLTAPLKNIHTHKNTHIHTKRETEVMIPRFFYLLF